MANEKALGPETVRDFIRRELQRARLMQRGEAAMAIEEAMANGIASAWEADISDIATINVELNGTIIRQIKHIEALEEDKRVMDTTWLALLRAVAKIDPDTDTDWPNADDDTLLEQYDPWVVLAALAQEKPR